MNHEEAAMVSIAQAKRQVTLDVLARATQAIMMARGLDFTIDDVAEAAEVSRSTVFRHFATRDDLIVAATRIGQDGFTAQLPAYRGGAWQPWLRELCLAVHEMNFTASRLLTLATGAETLSGKLHDVGRHLDDVRRGRYPGIAETLWRAAGRDGVAPEQLLVVLATHLSPFFTAAVRHEAGADQRTAALMAETAITEAVLRLTSPSPGCPELRL